MINFTNLLSYVQSQGSQAQKRLKEEEFIDSLTCTNFDEALSILKNHPEIDPTIGDNLPVL